MRNFFLRAERIGRGAYLLIVILGAISFAFLSFFIIREQNRLEDQQDLLEQQQRALTANQKLIEDALVAECQTRDVIIALANQTVVLLKTQRPTPANEATIKVFETYSKQLQKDEACKRIEALVGVSKHGG